MILRNACVEPQILHMMVCAPPIRCCFVTIKIYACIFMLILFSYCIFFLFSSGYCLCSSMFFVAIHEFASAFSPCYHQFFRRSQTPVMGPEPDFFLLFHTLSPQRLLKLAHLYPHFYHCVTNS